MFAPPSSSFVRRARAVLLVLVPVLALALAGGAAGALPPGASGAAVDAAAQERADADLWAVWQVVIALGVVTVGLLVLLVLYVRATSPRRAGRARRAPAPLLAEVAAELDAAPGDEAEENLEPEAREPVVAVAGPAPTPGRSSVDAPTPPPPAPRPAAPRRARRVDAPAKKLGTPDAERVLVRPGQAPIRVPAVPPAGDPAAAPAPAPPSTPRLDGPPPDPPTPPAPEPSEPPPPDR